MGCKQTLVDSKGRMLTRRFLNLLTGKLAEMKCDACAFTEDRRCGMGNDQDLIKIAVVSMVFNRLDVCLRGR